MNKDRIPENINQSILNQEPIIGVSIGNGRSAKQASRGGTGMMCFHAHFKLFGFIPGAFM